MIFGNVYVHIIMDYIGPIYNPVIDIYEFKYFLNFLVNKIKFIRCKSNTPRKFLDFSQILTKLLLTGKIIE